ncbi:hypothetical protein M408DRAFT_27878 [Serendipita vermifera MAFF 305830]|uniref:Uncharacterized protein n=1 Tax=Serendipita vermifera MAFF 305830 TaxID=933852 RepID=A0A0C3ATT3_SERVB|nr:hypothetical protein M408DRAFT_27878 [Serendipita vermifera MAFF 305830]
MALDEVLVVHSPNQVEPQDKKERGVSARGASRALGTPRTSSRKTTVGRGAESSTALDLKDVKNLIDAGQSNGIVMGDIPAANQMVSTVILNPFNSEQLTENQEIRFEAKIDNLQAGSFVNA